MADLFNNLLDSLDSLTETQITELLSRLEVKRSGQKNKTDKQGLVTADGQIIACPHCGSVSVKKHGRKDNRQRYYCKDCHKTFSSTARTMFYHSRLTREQWMGLLKGLVLNLSLNKIADDIGTSVKAVWYNKQKVMSLLSEMFVDQDRFTDIAECDEYSVHLSFKGKRDPSFFIYKLGRMPRHHRSIGEKIEYLQKAGLWDRLQSDQAFLNELLYGDKWLEGTNKDSVCILSGKDRSGNLYLNPVCVGSIESSHISRSFKGRFEPDAIMVTDGNNSYNWFAEYENVHHVQILSRLRVQGPYNLGRIDAIHSKMSAYWPVARENLPSTKYLDLNVMLFWWLEKNRDLTTKQQVEELYAYISERGTFSITYEKLKNRSLQLDTKGIIPAFI